MLEAKGGASRGRKAFALMVLPDILSGNGITERDVRECKPKENISS